jgi:hypothetical protein
MVSLPTDAKRTSISISKRQSHCIYLNVFDDIYFYRSLCDKVKKVASFDSLCIMFAPKTVDEQNVPVSV